MIKFLRSWGLDWVLWILLLAWAFLIVHIWKNAQDYKTRITESAKCVVVTDDNDICDLQQIINEHRELFVDNGGIIVGNDFVAVVDKDTFALQIVQTPIKRITSNKTQETTKPKDDKQETVGAKE